MKLSPIAVFCVVAFSGLANAGLEAFHAGPLIAKFGKIATVESDFPVPAGGELKVSFDVAKQADPGAINRNIESVARLLNMHAAAGTEQPKVTVVVHGGAAKDLLSAPAYREREGVQSANTELLQTLMKHKVEFVLCGQSGAYYDVNKENLEPGVKVALSAMTAHAVLQQQGYSLNPF